MLTRLGILLASLMSIIGLGGVLILFSEAKSQSLYLQDVGYIFGFTSLQAGLSALISIGLAVPLCLAIFHLCRFRLVRDYVLPSLMHTGALLIVFPSTVVAQSLLIVWGKGGVFAPLRETLDIPMFGLSGILLGHVFLNLPLSFRLLMPQLLQIPANLQRQAALLHFSPIRWFFVLAYPSLKPALLSVFGLVFLVCFTSFALVLMLGGGPAASNFEVAIYEAVRFELDFSRAAILSLIQLIFCGLIVWLLPSKSDWLSVSRPPSNIPLPPNTVLSFLALVMLFIFFFLIFPPLFWLVKRGIGAEFFLWLEKPIFYQSMGFSLLIASISSIGATLISLVMIETCRTLPQMHKLIMACGNLFLVIPTIVFGTGMFLWFRHNANPEAMALFIVILANILFSLPFCLRILSAPILGHGKKYNLQYNNLGLFGLRRLWWGEWRAHKSSITFALSISAAFSLGDLGVISLFHQSDFTTLPWLLYSVQGRYQADAAAALAIWLLLLVLGLMMISAWLGKNHQDERHA